MSAEFNNEYWTDYGAYQRQNAKGKLRGARYALGGAAAGSFFGPVGAMIGGAGGYLYGVFSAAKDRVESNGKCPSWNEVGKEAAKTAATAAGSVSKSL